MSKNLILFSGGLDSSYLAYKLLTDTSDEITLLAVVSENGLCEGINRQQVLNMQPLIKELKSIRNFDMKYLYADSSEVTSIEMDRWNTFPMYKFASEFANGTYDKLVSGTTWEQCDGAFFKHSSVRGYPKHLDAQKIFSSLTDKGSLWNPLMTHDIHQNFNRWHVLKYLPENLSSKSISCSAGKTEDSRCGQCDKCALNSRVRTMIGNGATASDVDDWRRTKSLEYGGTGTRDSGTQRWIMLEEFGSMSNTKKGVADDIPDDLEIPSVITNKEDFIKWYSTIEYITALDYRLIKWGLDKTAWNPESV